MYDIVPWLEEFWVFAIVIIGYVAVSWRLLTAMAPRVQLQARDGYAISKDVLSTGNLASELKTVTAKWFQLGINLGLETYELNMIQRDNQGSDQQMLQTLDVWLRREPNASWVDVVNALEEMRENKAAKNIRQKYIRGGIQTYCQLGKVYDYFIKKEIPALGTEEGVKKVKITIAGYECEFVDPPPPAFEAECPVCKLVLREPYQATCCGKSFCQTCIQPLQAKKRPCPTCWGDFQLFPNKGLKHSLNQLHVYCTHKDRRDGCKWSGELQEFEKHLNKNGSEETWLLGCKFVEIPCEFHYAGCKVETAREDMATHMSEQLSYHTELLTGKINEQNKHNVMERLTKSLHHKDAIIHELQDKLISAKIDSSRLQRKDEQLVQQMQKAAQNLPIYNQPIPIDEIFTMEQFQECKENDSQWYSPPFYTHPRGYKMCLRVDANGYDKGSGTHLSLFTCFMKGDFDSKLPWPFYGQIVVELLNQNANDHHQKYTIYYDHSTTDYAGRMRIDTNSRGWGNSRFISQKLLKKSNSKVQYLKDDCLKFRVREVLHTRDSGKVNTIASSVYAIGSSVYAHWPFVVLIQIIIFVCLVLSYW